MFGAHAVNAFCEPARMTADIDVLSTDAAKLSDDLRAVLSGRFGIAVPVREVKEGGFRVYPLRKPKNRHLVDVRQVSELPPFRRLEDIRVIEPAELAALKAIAIAARSGHEKALSDRLDLHRLLRTFPELRAEDGPIPLRLRALARTPPRWPRSTRSRASRSRATKTPRNSHFAAQPTAQRNGR